MLLQVAELLGGLCQQRAQLVQRQAAVRVGVGLVKQHLGIVKSLCVPRGAGSGGAGRGEQGAVPQLVVSCWLGGAKQHLGIIKRLCARGGGGAKRMAPISCACVSMQAARFLAGSAPAHQPPPHTHARTHWHPSLALHADPKPPRSFSPLPCQMNTHY